MKAHFSMFAAYNRWAHERLYQAAGKLSDADYRADRGAFFGSLNGTLTHILVGDRIWMRRFTGEGPVHARLDEIVLVVPRPGARTPLNRCRKGRSSVAGSTMSAKTSSSVTSVGTGRSRRTS